jgi:F420-non-reducing hydrogenase iron-sulfur subunit
MNITAFCCNNSLYGHGAAGTGTKAGAKGLRIIELPCSSRLDPIHILKAFENGADGVVVIACPETECRMQKGSKLAAKRVEYTKQLLEEAGVNPARLMLFRPEIPSAPKIAEIAKEAMKVLESIALQSAA